MELHYDGRAQGRPLELSLSGQRQQTLVLRNVTDPSRTTLFKVQCTAPRKLRVRPALRLLHASGDSVSIHVHLNPQEYSSATCKLLVVGRQALSTAGEDEQLKSMWTAAEVADAQTLLLSETVNIHIQSASDAAANDDKPVTLSTTPQLMTMRLTTTQLAELVLLIMKSQSRRKENELTAQEQEQLQTARAQHVADWPYWEEYAARMRKLLRERNKRKPQTT
ncbi:hypothetical protein F444_00485 [Phytophthora nicotianae P1976]|uniref:MSP domain-containing protein n=1 Tax=Phytophthora nicotianae P1976 TaxID=1317066 RepID=A0A081B428_PHYNI|nr:hypothetical protein F444_00485 [Phytophthora nicotianae P1976]